MAARATEPESRRAERRSHHQRLSRTQLLDAAEEVFGRRGFYETTLRDVAELAEFSVGSVYSFFENKEDLYLHVFLRRGEEYLPAMRAVVEEGGGARRQLHRLVDFEVGFFREHPHFGRLYLRSARAGVPPTSDSPVDRVLVERVDEAMAIHSEVFSRGQREGVFCDGDPEVLARLLSGLVSAFHSVDAAVLEGNAAAEERFPLASLHEMVDRAFQPDRR
jgi:AcrR family transcriptional regulator